MNNRRLMAHLLLTVAYVASGKLGLMLALAPGYASPIFPPAGIAVAAAFIGGKRTLPWIFLGSLLLNVWVDYSAHHQINATGFAAASAIAAASMLQAALGGWWLRRVIGYPAPFDRGHDILYFLLSAPIICLTSAALSVSALTALGIIGASGFAVNWAAWWVGDTLGVVVMLPLVMIAVGAPRALWQSRVRTVAIPMLLIFAFFVVIFLKTNQWEYNDSLTEFRQLSQQTVNRVQTQLEGQEFLLEQTARLFIHDVGGHVTREAFHRFVENSLARFPAIQALEWAPRVDAARRADFEAAQRKGFPGFEIREQNAAGQLQRAGERAQFYPVTYVEPLAGNEPASGFDLASTPDRQAALGKAVERKVAVATPPVRLVQERGEQAGMLLLLAVNNGSNGSGIVLAALRMDDFMGKLLLDTQSMLHTRFIDLDAQKTLYDNFAPGNRNVFYEHTFSFGTRHYRLQTAPTPAYFMQHHGWQSWSVLAAGLLGTGLFGALLLLGTGYTARIEAEVRNRTEELKESESRFRNTLEHAPIGMATASLDGRLLQVNHALCAILGYEKEELEKLTIREITHPEDAASSFANIKRLLDGELDYYQSKKRYLRKDGQPVWAQLTASIERDGAGAPLYFIGQIEDITERKRAEEALGASEKKFRALFEEMVSGFALHEIIYDEDGKPVDYITLEVNREFERLLNTSRENVIGKKAYETVPGLDRKWLDIFGKVALTGEPLSYEEYASNLDKWFAGTVFSPQKGMAAGTFIDITERKRAEQALAESESRFREIFNTVSDAIFIHDAETGRIVDVNRSMCEMYGVTREEAFACGPDDLSAGVPPYSSAEAAEKIRLARTDGPQTFDWLARARDGRLFWVEVSLQFALIGSQQRILAVVRDITERREFMEELKRSNIELEQFSYAVSHDMRQPLRMISSYLQLIERSLADQLDNEKRGYFDFAIEGAKRIDQMLVALLEYSRVGRMGEPPTMLDSRAILDEALQFLQPAIAEARANVVTGGGWPHIMARHDEILRLLQNLIGNAIKYRVAGRAPEITVTSGTVKNEWHLCVADNGVGIIPDQIKRLFQVFQRLQSREAYEGTGIGLALCRKIAEHHKGRIWAESAGEGKGSKFYVVLPVLRGDTMSAKVGPTGKSA